MFTFRALGRCWRAVVFTCAPVLLWGGQLLAQTNEAVYTDSPQNGWDDSYSWATINDVNPSPVHSGAHSISVASTYYEGLYFHQATQANITFTNLTFWVNGGATGGQTINVQATTNGVSLNATVLLPALPVNTWRQQTIALAALGVTNLTTFDGFWLQVNDSGTAPTFYVDDINLIGFTNPPAPSLILVTNPPVGIIVDAGLNPHPISPLIYGVAFGTSSDLLAINATLNRQGGNTTTRYNWTLNADNHAADYYFASLAEDSATPGELGDTFVATSRAGGAEPSLTIPMIDWVAKLAANRARTWSYSIAKYGPQQLNDAIDGWPDMGNGAHTDGSPIITNNPNDANVSNSVALEQGWLNHLTNTWGRATNGGVRYYHLDNEPGIWQSTHQDVHPNGVTMDELVNKMTNYATMIKATDPGALVLGPEEWSYDGAVFSGADNQYEAAHNYPGTYPDRAAHGGDNVYAYVLAQFAKASAGAGHRLLDVCTIHDYPQSGEFGTDVTLPAVLLRNRSTRQFWDTNYVDPSWLADNSLTAIVAMIPHLHQWVATNYPGTLTGITEYNWGAETNISGAAAQADILGIFGREGLDVGERWTMPPTGSPVYNAFKMYRNYDGHNSAFGNTGITATGPNPDNVSTFAALRSTDGALTLMVINKQPDTNAPVIVTLTNFIAAGTAQVWQLTASNIITQTGSLAFSGHTFSNLLPAQSITLFVVPVSPVPTLHAASYGGNTFNFSLGGQSGKNYAILSSSNLVNWIAFQTDLLTAATLPLSIPVTNSVRFYRAQSLPP